MPSSTEGNLDDISLPDQPEQFPAPGADEDDNWRGRGLRAMVPAYAVLFFDQLYSEYLTLEPSITSPETRKLLAGIHQKRVSSELTWSDIYTFDLALMDARPIEDLIRKAYDARAKYRTVAGKKEFEEYWASKPTDLSAIHIASNSAGHREEIIERALRADIRFLISKIYLSYALSPVREATRWKLMSKIIITTTAASLLCMLAIAINFGAAFLFGVARNTSFLGVTVLSVALAGVIGGGISAIQRIQALPSEGDVLFNLTSLANTWRGHLLPPVFGGVFAVLLFVLFASGFLQGTTFPRINTTKTSFPTSQPSPGARETPTPLRSESTPAESAAAGNQGTPASQTSTSTPPQVAKNVEPKTPLLVELISQMGPADGVSFALLIIWSFLAGFAERLVPDMLNRIVAKSEATQGSNS